jgi:hypothetical protein
VQFGIDRILSTLPLDRSTLEWKVDTSVNNNSNNNNNNNGNDSSTTTTTSSSSTSQGAAATSGNPSSPTIDNAEPGVLMNRLRDLFVVVWTAQQASAMIPAIRTLPKSTNIHE